MSANSPKPGDSNVNLLEKLLRVFGGSPQPADGANILLQKILRAAEAADSNVETLTYAASVELDFGTAEDKTLALTGDVTFTSANLEAGREISVRIVADGSTRALAFPAGWVFLGSAPSDIAAGKTGILSLKAYGSADSDVVAAYSVES